MKYLLSTLIVLAPIFVNAQSFAEITAGIGFTAISIEDLVEKDEISGTTANDWGQFNAGVSGQYYFTELGNVLLGAELMYHYLYWYSVNVPFGSTSIYREYAVSAIRITPVFRFQGNGNFSFDLGPELNFIGEGISPGVLASANYSIPISDAIQIPIKLRLDVLQNVVVMAPISLQAGVRIAM